MTATAKDLEKHLRRELDLNRLENACPRARPLDMDAQWQAHFDRTERDFDDHTLHFNGGVLHFHDRTLEVVSERKRGGAYHTFLRGNAAHYRDCVQQADIPVEIRLVSATPLRSVNLRDIHQFVLSPSIGVIGFLLREDNRLRVLVAQVSNVEVLMGHGLIRAAKAALALEDTPPALHARRHVRM